MNRSLSMAAARMVAATLSMLAITPLPAQTLGPYQSPDLPPVLEFLDGRKVETPAQWEERRKELAELWQTHYLGHFPEHPPKLLLSEISETASLPHHERSVVTLTFETPGGPIPFQITVLQKPPDGRPRPLLLTQPRHYQMVWAEEAVRRGYTVCLYPGVDYNHRENDFPAYEGVWKRFREAYPAASWHSSLGIQAWIASRALDFFLAHEETANGGHRPFPIIEDQVGIIGHSRYGKQALYAAAFDPRITAVLARSSGSPTAAGYRFTARHTFMETVRDFPPEWALPSLKAYFGRENRLPVEGNGLLALIAPRACLLHTALHDGGDPTFAVERTYRSAKKAYQLLGAPDKLTLQYRAGNHNPITEAHVRDNLDWFDTLWGRRSTRDDRFAETLLHHFDWNQWKARQTPADLAVPHLERPLGDRIRWLLGEPASTAEPKRVANAWAASGVATWSRDRWKPPGVQRIPVTFGGDLPANLMLPEAPSETQAPRPVVIWLHPFNYSHGYNEGYGVEGTTLYYRLAQHGYAVLCYDQLGFGDRLLEGPAFDAAHPRWSRLGRMVHDVQRGIDFIEGEAAAFDLDPSRVYLVGYSLGGMVALHAGALDSRIAGIAVHAGFTPFRTDHDAAPTGGRKRWSHWHGLLPKLGLFQGSGGTLPYDVDELLVAASPRPILVVAPQNDWHVTLDDVRACLEKAQASHPRITFETPVESNRFQARQQERVLRWLESLEPREHNKEGAE